MGTTPKQWTDQVYVLRKSFDSDRMAMRDGYAVGDEYYTLGGEQVPRKEGYFMACASGRVLSRGWVRIRLKVPVTYGDPWEEELKQEIERELKSNYDLIGIFLRDMDTQWCRTLHISWMDSNE